MFVERDVRKNELPILEKLWIDTGSDGGGRSTSSNLHQQGANWKTNVAGEEATRKKGAAQLMNKLSAQAFVAAASGMVNEHEMPIEKPPGL